MIAMAEEEGELDCPVCLAPLEPVLITRCSHLFCRPCLRTVLSHADPRCPLCRRPLSPSDVFSASSGDSAAASGESSTVSSKTAALLRLLSETRARRPEVKTAVFSQFRTALLRLEDHLGAAGFTTIRLDVRMSPRRRAQAAKEFTDGHGGTVMLVSQKAAVGIDLTAATTVCILEPWWDPAAEERAVGRVHRIGQREAVRVVKMVVRESVEEKMVELQKKKKKKKMVVSSMKGAEVGLQSMGTLVSLFS